MVSPLERGQGCVINGCAALPLMKGGRGMLIPKGAATLCVVSKHADADANETSPYPLHKGDFSVCTQILRCAQDDNYSGCQGGGGIMIENL